MKKLSIIIVNYNTKQYLTECLQSIGTIPDDWEIIVVDNGSKNTPRIKESNNQRIKLLINKDNVGFAKANNQAIEKTDSRYVLLLNPDTIVSQKAIQSVLDYMDTDSSIGVATCRVEFPTGEIDDASHRGFPTPWRAFCHFSGLSRLFASSIMFNGYHLGYQNIDEIHEIDACVGAFMMIRGKVGRELNWLDEDYFWYGEDLDFCYRVKKHGWSVIYIPAEKIVHFKGVSSGIKKHSREVSTADERTTRIAQDARFDVMRLFYDKHYKNAYPFFIRWLVYLGVRITKFIKTGRI